MIFQDGELRRAASSKPMLFDGWAYVPIELNSDIAEERAVMGREPEELRTPTAKA